MKRIILSLFTILAIALAPAGLLPATVSAACDTTGSSSKDQVINGIGETGSDCSGQGVTNIITVAVNLLSLIVGIASIIVVIYAGFKYITSAGESGRVANAKNTLIYALVGLVIASLAQFLIHFVLNQADTATKQRCPTGQHLSKDGTKCV